MRIFFRKAFERHFAFARANGNAVSSTLLCIPIAIQNSPIVPFRWGKTTTGEKWLYDVRTIHYILVLPEAIFPRGGGQGLGVLGRGNHSLTVATERGLVGDLLATVLCSKHNFNEI